MKRGVVRLNALIAEIDEFDVKQLRKRWDAGQKALEARIEGVLQAVFGSDTLEYQRFRRAHSLDNAGITMSAFGEYPEAALAQEAQRNVAQGKIESVALLRTAVQWLQDEIEEAGHASASAPQTPARSTQMPRKVFIVHGHDAGAKEAVARFLEKLSFSAVILSEQANGGRTIIEKIEANHDVGFAVVLLTPDDVGAKAGQPNQPRARQNVILELGYFMGKLGRPNVCALSVGEMELPTDFAGVVWTRFDPDTNGWKLALAHELQAAGFDIDWNAIMGRS